MTDLLKAGSNTLVVRAEDPPTDRFIPRGKQYWKEKSESIFYTRTTGIWQTVWLEAVGDSYLSHVRITPTMDGAVRFDARLARGAAGQTLRAVISFEGAEVARGEAKTDGGRASLGLAVADPRTWNIGQGRLYDVTLELVRGTQVVDRVQTYYGYREIVVDAKGLQFNGRRAYLKMVLDQGYWPESLLTPPSDEAIQYDIKTTQAMGFNGARKHQKVEDPRFLYWADKLGFLVSGEMANAYLYDDQYVGRFTREWLEVLERDINHPSIVMWIPINESWGTPNLRDKRQQAHLKANYMLTKSIDQTRLVIENDGWEHVDTTDVFGIHDYARTGELLAKKYAVLDNPAARIPDNSRAALVPGYEYNGSPIFLSEFGGIAYHVPGSPAPEGAWGYSGVEKTPEDALARLRGPVRGHRERAAHHRRLLHAVDRRRAGDQRAADVRPQAEVRRERHQGDQRTAAAPVRSRGAHDDRGASRRRPTEPDRNAGGQEGRSQGRNLGSRSGRMRPPRAGHAKSIELAGDLDRRDDGDDRQADPERHVHPLDERVDVAARRGHGAGSQHHPLACGQHREHDQHLQRVDARPWREATTRCWPVGSVDAVERERRRRHQHQRHVPEAPHGREREHGGKRPEREPR